jgi:hypothetical protein
VPRVACQPVIYKFCSSLLQLVYSKGLLLRH